MLRPRVGVAFATATALACSADASADSRKAAKANAPAAAATDAFKLDAVKYKPAALSAVGSVSGSVSGSAAPSQIPDSVAAACAKQTRGRGGPKPSNGLAGAIVWIAGVSSGKAFSEDKRVELTSDECGLDPQTQAVSVGTTVNVINDDRALHKLVFVRDPHDTLTTMPFFNEGQIVASERIGKSAGVVDIRCVQHPLAHAYVFVFPHPYYATTDAAGRFTIDSLPPGRYTLRAWRAGDKAPTDYPITVSAGADAKVDVALK